MSLFLVLLIATANNSAATLKAAEAYSAQEHLGDNMQRYYESNFSKEHRAALDKIAMVAHAAMERKVVLCVTFP